MIRDIEFRIPVQVSILSERRVYHPYGLHGGEDAAVCLCLCVFPTIIPKPPPPPPFFLVTTRAGGLADFLIEKSITVWIEHLGPPHQDTRLSRPRRKPDRTPDQPGRQEHRGHAGRRTHVSFLCLPPIFTSILFFPFSLSSFPPPPPHQIKPAYIYISRSPCPKQER